MNYSPILKYRAVACLQLLPTMRVVLRAPALLSTSSARQNNDSADKINYDTEKTSTSLAHAQVRQSPAK